MTTVTEHFKSQVGLEAGNAAANVDYARKSLAKKAADVQMIDTHQLGIALGALAQAEGALVVWAVAARIMAEKDLTDQQKREAIYGSLVDFLGAGADDTWSGRNNDLRRAHFDGVREAARRVEGVIKK